ncbi:GntR-family transcriptional regulator [Oceanicola granulosus HTCC2516]|uniref:GntR-family transcriptional regulator n=1 Tax=Oceanicola granulosus (strain ATCC BAA-861 / DSM 15982 / KCTC 12143 / HTCC2516) TaxID=314256 RepID=Q2CGP2_OCEGH|nr:GntR family transcriptional regulator [Oceanicola granulosus]EAR51893.1 GntR-family transcriptional regulator [Oceanicola granulosus HTCC2516]
MSEDMKAVRLAPIQFQAAPLRAKIIESMRRAIERGNLQPGDRLVEKDLCEQLGVSRTSLREALRELEAEGIVAQLGARGLTVVKISRRDAENIYRIRADIEALIFEQFLGLADAAALSQADALCENIIAAYKGGDFVAIVDAKRAFYEFVCGVANNRIAHELLNRLTLRTAQLRSKSVVREERQNQSIEEIRALKRALLARDVDAAREAARSHVGNAAKSALPFVEDTPDDG